MLSPIATPLLVLAAAAVAASLAVPAPSPVPGIPMPKAFEGDITIKVSLFPIAIKGHLNYDYDAQKQLIASTIFGITQYEADRYDLSLKYVWATVFGETKCNTCYLKPPLFPYYVPPGSINVGKEVVDGKDCTKYQWGLSDLGLNATFWVTDQAGTTVMVKSIFHVGYSNFFTVDFEMDFANIVPGPQAASLFEPPANVCPPPRCAGKVNVGLLFDGSGSVAAADFVRAQEFGVAVVDAFKVGKDAAEIAVTQFSSTVRTEIALSPEAGQIIDAIRSMVQLRTGTNTAAGIESLARGLQDRASDNKVMLIITDGKANQGGDPIAAAEAAKKEGVEIFSIGVGSDIDKAQLEGMASAPVGLHVYTVDNFAALKNITAELVSSSCPSDEQCDLSDTNQMLAAHGRMLHAQLAKREE